MTDPVNALVAFFRELKRRRVVHAVLVYAGGAFLVLEGVSNLSEALHLSGTLEFVVAIAVIAGFPVALVLAWMYEWTGQGVRRASPVTLTRGQRWAMRSALAVVVAGAAVGVGALAVRPPRTPEPAASPPGAGSDRDLPRRTVVAVLPFEHPGGEQASNRLAMELEAQVEAALAESPAFTLRWRSAVKPLVEQRLALDSVARRLGIDYFVHAQVTDLETEPSIVVELVDARTLDVLSSARIREGAEGSLGLLDALTRRMEDILRPALGRHVRLREWRAGTTDTVAFRLRWRAEQRRQAGLSLGAADAAGAAREYAAADSLLQMAGERDPEWRELQLARARLAGDLALALRQVGDRDGVAAAFDRGIACVERALESDPDDPDALALRGYLLWRRTRFTDVPEPEARRLVDRAEQDLRSALDRDPNNAGAAATLSELLYMDRARYDQAFQYGELAYRLDAYLDDANEIVNRTALSAFEMGDDAVAAAWCREGLNRTPAEVLHHACMLTVLAWGKGTPDAESARAHYEAIVHNAPSGARGLEPYFGFLLAAALARADDESAAREVLIRARSLADSTLGPDAFLWPDAAARFRLGDSAGGRRLMDRLRAVAPATAERAATRRALRDYVETPGETPLPG